MEMYGAGGYPALATQAGQRTPALGLQPRTTTAAEAHVVGPEDLNPGPHAYQASTWFFEMVTYLAQADLKLTGLTFLILLPLSSVYEDYKSGTRPDLVTEALY